MSSLVLVLRLPHCVVRDNGSQGRTTMDVNPFWRCLVSPKIWNGYSWPRPVGVQLTDTTAVPALHYRTYTCEVQCPADKAGVRCCCQ